MGTRPAHICVSTLLPLLRELEAAGRSPARILARHGLELTDLEDPYLRISLSRYLNLTSDAALLFAEPALGVKTGLRYQASDLGPVGLIFSASGSLRRGLMRLAESLPVWQDATSIFIEEDDEGRVIWNYRLIDPAFSLHVQENETAAVATSVLAQAAFGAAGRPIEAHFMHHDHSNKEQLARHFLVPPHFGQSCNRLVFSPAANRLVRPEDRTLMAILERHIKDLRQSLYEADDLILQVRQLIYRGLPSGRATLEQISKALGMGPRSLQRRLSDRHTSINQISTNLKVEIIKSRIQEGAVSIESLAEGLGYADGTALWRAFKTATGMSPSAYRKESARRTAPYLGII